MQNPNGALVGQKGVKYGLQKPGVKKPPVASAPPKPLNIFGADDSDEDVEAEVARQAEKKRSAAKVPGACPSHTLLVLACMDLNNRLFAPIQVQQAYAEALAQDPNAFAYDDVYEDIQTSRVQPKQQEKIERKSRYIAQLMDQAVQRKREQVGWACAWRVVGGWSLACRL